MPITQNRMISLLHAAQDYKQALEAAEDYIQVIRGRLTEQKIRPEEAFLFVEQYINRTTLLKNRYSAGETIAVEARHFLPTTIARNERAATKLSISRGGVQRPAAQPIHSPESFNAEVKASSGTAPQSLVISTEIKSLADLEPESELGQPEKGSFKATDGKWYPAHFRDDPRITPAPGWELAEAPKVPEAVPSSLAEESERERRKALIRQNQSDPEEDVFYPASAEAETEGGEGGS